MPNAATLFFKKAYSSLCLSTVKFVADEEHGQCRSPGIPRDPWWVVEEAHISMPDNLPSESATQEQVQYFLYDLLTTKSFKAIKNPQWVVETCDNWKGTGKDLRTMANEDFQFLCPRDSVSKDLHSSRVPIGQHSNHDIRKHIGCVVREFVRHKLAQEAQAPPKVRQKWLSEMNRSASTLDLQACSRVQSQSPIPAPRRSWAVQDWIDATRSNNSGQSIHTFPINSNFVHRQAGSSSSSPATMRSSPPWSTQERLTSSASPEYMSEDYFCYGATASPRSWPMLQHRRSASDSSVSPRTPHNTDIELGLFTPIHDSASLSEDGCSIRTSAPSRYRQNDSHGSLRKKTSEPILGSHRFLSQSLPAPRSRSNSLGSYRKVRVDTPPPAHYVTARPLSTLITPMESVPELGVWIPSPDASPIKPHSSVGSGSGSGSRSGAGSGSGSGFGSLGAISATVSIQNTMRPAILDPRNRSFAISAEHIHHVAEQGAVVSIPTYGSIMRRGTPPAFLAPIPPEAVHKSPMSMTPPDADSIPNLRTTISQAAMRGAFKSTARSLDTSELTPMEKGASGPFVRYVNRETGEVIPTLFETLEKLENEGRLPRYNLQPKLGRNRGLKWL